MQYVGGFASWEALVRWTATVDERAYEDVLIAMAGERMRPDGACEVSGVCTHPDHRGRGLARALMAAVARRIVARGDMPFLHVYPSNVGAIALYESLGFTIS